MFKIKKGILSPNKFINPNNILIKFLYLIIVYLSIPIFLISLLLNIKSINIIKMITNGSIMQLKLFIILPEILIIIFLHELGHSIVARFNGATISEIGIMLCYFMPCCYTNIIGIHYVKNKYKRILIFISGILVNLLLAGLGLLASKFVNDTFYYNLFWFSLFNITLAILNIMIAPNTDGYRIIKEMLNKNY